MMEFLETYHLVGIVVGAATFLIIGVFHPFVIKGEYYFGVRCWWAFAVAGVAALAASLPGELADRYERAAKHCGGVAVAILNENACGACRVPIDAGRLASIKREAPLSMCPHCKRLLVVAG